MSALERPLPQIVGPLQAPFQAKLTWSALRPIVAVRDAFVAAQNLPFVRLPTDSGAVCRPTDI